MHKLLKFSWTRALGSAALLAVAAVVFIVLILPAAAFGSKKSKKSHYCASLLPSAEIQSFSPTKGKVGKSVMLLGKHMDHAKDVWFMTTNGRVQASFNLIDNQTIQTWVPGNARSGKIAVGSSFCNVFTYSKQSLNVK